MSPLSCSIGGPLETTPVNPWQIPSPLSPHCPIVSTKHLDESSLPLSPTAVGCLSQRGDLLGLETQGRWVSVPSSGEQYHSYILRRWRPAFLDPKGEIQICHRADEQNALKIVSPPPIKVLTKPVHLRKPLKCKANENLHPQPRVKTSIKIPAITCAASHRLPGSAAVP
jgi:hypothetical protein